MRRCRRECDLFARNYCGDGLNGTLSSSATICRYAVNTVPVPKSGLPTRIKMVLSAWISIHDSGQSRI